ncbi:MAG TPA: aspartate aminotransferase family protein [Planctomycetaceae bacterium]|nr:aspartate aminotransferase family protein [Planctomycetaceae bacterium]HRF01964.1 aspartate aminotransferase family protein [Pirellulaceae bacterium]
MTQGHHPSSARTQELFDRFVIGNYRRYPVNLVKGVGSEVWDAEGRRYVDFFPGWGCNLLGHCPPKVVQAVRDQVGELIHVPNSWLTDLQGRWAQLLSERSFDGQAFFCNSGAEANEAAIKLARLHGKGDRYRIVSFTGGFHGRTLGALTATAQPKYHEGLGPLVAGFDYAPFGDLDAAARLIGDETCAILVEPIQGEGGVHLPPDGFLEGLRALCDEHGLLLIFDEVQTGCGRTGEWFGYQRFGVLPDVITLAKSLCGGIAGGALLARREIAPSLRPGMHASTFGGNPIAAAAGIATIETIEDEGLLERVGGLEAAFRERIEGWRERFDFIDEVRIAGMMIGIALSIEGAPVVQAALDNGLLINCTQGTVLRLLPAMNLDDEQFEEGCDLLEKSLTQVQATLAAT